MKNKNWLCISKNSIKQNLSVWQLIYLWVCENSICLYANQEELFMSNRNILAEVVPREGRTKPGEDEDSIDDVLTVLCNCNYSNRIKSQYKIMSMSNSNTIKHEKQRNWISINQSVFFEKITYKFCSSIETTWKSLSMQQPTAKSYSWN